MCVVQPVHIVNKLVSFRTKANRLDVEVVKAKIIYVHAQVLRLDSHELWVEPSTEPLTVEGLPPFHMVIVVDVFHGNSCHIRFDLANVKEHFINFLILVSVWATKIIAFTNSLFHLQTIKNGESNIVSKDWLNCCVHTFYLPKHSVKHLHMHTPFGCNCYVRVKSLYHVSGSQDGYIWADSFDFLLPNPLGSQASALRVRISTSR